MPALAAVAAAPVLASSTPTVGPVTATKGSKQVSLTIPITNAAGKTITISAISGGGGGASTWVLPVTYSIDAIGASGVVVRGNNPSGTYTASYMIDPGGYTGTFVFSV